MTDQARVGGENAGTGRMSATLFCFLRGIYEQEVKLTLRQESSNLVQHSKYADRIARDN